jgi:hypothetical protein
LTVAIGNLGVSALSANAASSLSGPTLFFFYAGLAFLAGIALGLIARNYKPVEHYGEVKA